MLPQKIHKIAQACLLYSEASRPIICWYIDDSYLQGTGYDQCLENVKDTVTLFNKLELLIHPDKSVLHPTQQIVLWGFQLNSVTLALSLTTEKAGKVKDACANLLRNLSPTIRKMS